MRHGADFVIVLVATLAGCTHQQLTRSTVLTTGTVMDIEYRTVLMNLAMMSCHPEAFPSHADLAQGVVQVNDRLGLGQSGGFTTFTGGDYGFGLDTWGPSGQRQVTEQWGTDATTDPQRLNDLQDLYRAALGLSPLPPPNAIAYLRRSGSQEQKDRPGGNQEKDSKGGGSKDDSGSGSASSTSGSSRSCVIPSSYVETSSGGPSPASAGGGGSVPSSSGGSSSGDGNSKVPIDVLLSDVPPPGWFCIGCKHDIPKNACYVGQYGDRYAWVTADGVPALSRFTLTVLVVIKLKPGEASKSHGLAVTSQ